jgi:hypothetical protein
MEVDGNNNVDENQGFYMIVSVKSFTLIVQDLKFLLF